MAELIEALRQHLRTVDTGARLPPIDLARHRSHLLKRLEEIERDQPTRAQRELAAWRSRLPRFVTEVAQRLSHGLGVGLDATAFAALIDAAIDIYLEIQVPWLSAVRRAELWDITFESYPPREEAGLDLGRYSFEVRLVRGDDRVVTHAGRVWLATPGEDAIRLLLALEAAQSTGRLDRFRVARSSASALVQEPMGWLPDHADAFEQNYPASWRSLQRLEALGLLDLSNDEGVDFYQLTELGRRLLAEVASGETVWSLAAAALVEEERGASVGSLVPALERLEEHRITELSAREARLVAHEVRNALVPVRVQLDRMYRALTREAPSFDPTPFQEPIDLGVARVFEFVEGRLQIASIVEAAVETFELDPAIRDALDATAEATLAGGSARVRGPRATFVIVIGELVRNARGAAAVRVRVASSRRNGRVVVQVDDDGVGVAPEHAGRIFERGFSTRGGSGQGLALAKEFVEAMSGTLTVDRSDLGGARFTIELPVAESEERS